MEKNFVKRFLTKDGKQRISIYQETDAENPRYMTDEPLHCEDWHHNYSIMTQQEMESKSSSARDFIIYMLVRYGKREAIIDTLVENGKHMTDGKSICDNALVYEHSMRRWVLKRYIRWGWKNGKYDCWTDEEYFDGRKDDIDFGTLIEACLDSTIDELCDKKYWTDGIKMCSYGFDYYNGDVFFYESFDTNSKGIAWLEKEEFLKYSGNGEGYWKGKTLKEVEWLLEGIEAWSNNEVYGYVVEDCIKSKVHKEYTNVDKEDEDYEEEEWKESDSCWGFYRELDKSLDWILEDAGFKKEDLTEE